MAVLEVGLIFLGITFAIGFENWNNERAERENEPLPEPERVRDAQGSRCHPDQ